MKQTARKARRSSSGGRGRRLGLGPAAGV